MSALTELLQQAYTARSAFFDDAHITGFRLFNGFLEGYPALSVDIYARTVLIHNYADANSPDIIPEVHTWIMENFPWVKAIIVKTRAGQTVAEKRGKLVFGGEPDTRIMENDIWYALDLTMNRDLSFYLDTRSLRAWLKDNLAGKTVLNTFAYTGSLGVAALAGGAAQVIQLDRNASFLKFAEKSYQLNGLNSSPKNLLAQDFFPAVGQLKSRKKTFDCVLLDPPFFATTDKGVVDMESNSARLINKVRPLINDGGWLVTINNALFVSGQSYIESLQALCAGGYLAIEQLIQIDPDFTGYPDTRSGQPPADPAPFNHSTKIAVLRVRRKSI